MENASLKPRPGIEGTTRWKGCWVDGLSGLVKWLKRGERLRFVRGKEGMRRSGMAERCGEIMWMKWIRSERGVGEEEMEMEMEMLVRNCGREVL